MNNEECRVRSQTVNVNSKEPAFFHFIIKTSKCSGSCNNTNVRAFNLMSKTNETRYIEQHETFKCKCRLDEGVCNNKQRWNDD